MLRILRKDLEKRKVHLVIVLDEADVLLKKAGPDVIYKLTRFEEEKVEGLEYVSLVLISQKNIYDMLDAASISTFKRTNVIEFGKYSCDELKDIVAQRAQLALHENAIDQDSFDLIAEVSSEWGDARFAIEILEKAGMLADEEGAGKVDVEHVRGAKAEAYSSVTESKLAGLERHQKLALLAIARASKGKAYITTEGRRGRLRGRVRGVRREGQGAHGVLGPHEGPGHAGHRERQEERARHIREDHRHHVARHTGQGADREGLGHARWRELSIRGL